MKQSAFQFTTPRLTSIIYKENSSIKLEHEKKFDCQSSISVKKRTQIATVELTMIIGEKDKTPFFICGQIEADFKWDDSFSDDMIDKMLKNNAASLLLSYLRPIIANITNYSRFHTINIPFMDFRESIDVSNNSDS